MNEETGPPARGMCWRRWLPGIVSLASRGAGAGEGEEVRVTLRFVVSSTSVDRGMMRARASVVGAEEQFDSPEFVGVFWSLLVFWCNFAATYS